MIVRISEVVKQIQSNTFRYEPAELHIRNHSAEMDTNWEQVWDELGLKKPLGVAREVREVSQEAALQATVQYAQEGDRLGNIAKQKTTFGQLAFERYMQKGQKEVRIYALPSQGVSIDVRIFPPEIQVQTKGVVRD
ncbi:DUF6470 family protein [Paenibacillus sp. MER TA 81-3]|uniref:DUF6470 family protein n=1 Tax=Paenibacillus sp. MER TA 81-3 TaxID=2939573 RepID=UPI00203C85FF|nr:DUF6470 family protein [Paenibacillus sp. MER TA 81-3]MCM3338732.1 DUF6470 family protein [Paenibacillus sp. MER TA 81-3]